MKRSFIFFVGLILLQLFGCFHNSKDLKTVLKMDDSQPLIRGTWALPVEKEIDIHPTGQVERKGNEIWVSLAVENFEKAAFDRYGYWDQSGNYEHAYGGERSGSFSYRFIGSETIPATLEIKARLSAESQAQGKADETSDVTLFINDVALGRKTVVPDNGVGRFYVWRVTDPGQMKQLKISADGNNEIRFVVDQKAKKKHGLCIYGKALDASAPEPGEPITIVYRLDAKGGAR